MKVLTRFFPLDETRSIARYTHGMKRTIRPPRAAFVALLALSALALAMSATALSCSSGSEADTDLPGEIVITVDDSHFRPALELSGAATVSVDYGDGSDPLVLSAAAGVRELADRVFADGAGEHDVSLVVTPWSALTVLNLGFRAGDGGNNTAATDVPVIAFHPPTTASGFENPDYLPTETEMRAFVGRVTAITGLQAATRLIALCCERQAVETVDCSNMTRLRSLEAFYSQVKSHSFQNCPELRRCCLESTGANTSWRIEGGVRVEDGSLDLRDSPYLQDIRGTGDDHDLLRLHPGALGTLWHLCKMFNRDMNGIQVGTEAPAPLDLTRFAALEECWIMESPVIDEVTVRGGSLRSVWLNSCGVRAMDLRDNDNFYELTAPGNPIESIAISGCDGLRMVDLRNCGLDQTQVDYVLAYVDSLDVTSPVEWPYTVSLGGNNAAPSATGLASAGELRARNWAVTTN